MPLEPQAAVGQHDDWAVKLDACAAACFDDYHAVYDLHDVLFRHVDPVGGEHHIDTALSPIVSIIEGVRRDGTAAGAFDVDDPAITATLCYSAIHGAFDASCHGNPRPDPDRYLRATQQLLRRAAGL